MDDTPGRKERKEYIIPMFLLSTLKCEKTLETWSLIPPRVKTSHAAMFCKRGDCD